jgi:hypothetical protein
MAKRHLSVVAISVSVFLTLVGCQQASQPVSFYPAPSFDAPRMIAQPTVAPTYIPSYGQIARATPIPARAMIRPSVIKGIPAAWIPPVPSRHWLWVIVHHSATTTGCAAVFDKMHRAKGWDELGYDFVIGNGTDTADGQIEVGPRWTKQKIGAHAKSPDNRFNEYGIGICLVGNFEVERPTPKQLASLEKLIAYMMVTYHITPDRILRHKDTKQTACPGRYLDINMVRRAATAMAGEGTLVRNVTPNTEMLTSVASPR